MTWPADAQGWMDVLDHAIVILGAIILAVVPSVFAARNGKKLDKVEAKANTIVGHVQNGHGDAPMRVDLDHILNAVNRLTTNVDRLAAELADERINRRDHITELRTDLAHHREDVHARLADLSRRIR